jgi:hypothetical protein
MQTIHYTAAKKVNTSKLMEDALIEISYKFGYQLISAFQAAFAIVLAFQVNDIVTKLVDLESVSYRYAIVIPILILCNIGTSYFKDKYIQSHDEEKPAAENSDGIKLDARTGSVHHFYQRR